MTSKDPSIAFEELFRPLFEDMGQNFVEGKQRPLLAHYTSIETLGKIVSSEELWFSNPLFMNDHEEVRFGLVQCANRLKFGPELKKALGTPERQNIFVHAFDHYVSEFENKHLLDTYVFCLSEHIPENQDGLLSMWRGYGGNGSGAAIVFDPNVLDDVVDSPLIVDRVFYGTNEMRFEWIDQLEKKLADILIETHVPDEHLYFAAHSVFQRLKFFALFSKHSGFNEENEWRVVYFSDHDTEGILKSMRGYVINSSGVEPKLRLKLGFIPGATSRNLEMEKVVHSIILGPSTSSLLAERSVQQMFTLMEKPYLADRLIASSIPLRPIGAN